jgi:CubicO group peptidase (beta-lactamase class C family)
MRRIGIICGTVLALVLLASQSPSEPGTGTLPVEEQPEPLLPQFPVTGKSAEVLAPFDGGVEKIMMRHGIPGAAVAITKDGRLVLAKGYGWAEFDGNLPVRPDTNFGLASLSKCFTTQAILKLVEDKKLSLDDKPFEILKHLQAPRGARIDPRLAKITIRHLLTHSGGWNRNVAGDPVNWSRQVVQVLGVRPPISDEHLIRFMLAVPLNFDPGSDAQYSNFGFIVLGRVIAQLSGKSYEEFVRETVLKPLGMKQTRMHDREGRYFQGEARRYIAGADRVIPQTPMPWAEASGGWSSSVLDLARFMTALDGSRGKAFLKDETMKEMVAPPEPPLKLRPDQTYFGLGWDSVQKLPAGYGYFKGGSWPGVRSSLRHRVDGINLIVLFNASMEPDMLDQKIYADVVREIHDEVAKIGAMPNVDLFKEFP